MNELKKIVDDFFKDINEMIDKIEKETRIKEPKFTEDEKAILRNLPEKYKYIARDKCNELFIYSERPNKQQYTWCGESGYCANFYIYEHIFQSIKWEDNEPCEFRKYL